MKISIVIAAYNASATISAALESCTQQSVPAWEVIVVDDASTDNTAEIVSTYPAGIRLLQHRHNKGVSAARNTGWTAATGDYIAFLDSDDTWHTEKLAFISSYLNEHQHTILLGHTFTTDPSALQHGIDILQEKQVSFGDLLVHNHFQGSSIILRRDITERFDERMRYCEDHDLAIRLSYGRPAAFLRVPLTLLSRPQRTKGGLSGDRWAMRKGELFAYSKLWRLNIAFLPLIPLLWLYSLTKHLFGLLRNA